MRARLTLAAAAALIGGASWVPGQPAPIYDPQAPRTDRKPPAPARPGVPSRQRRRAEERKAAKARAKDGAP